MAPNREPTATVANPTARMSDITVTVLRSDARAVREVMLHLARPLRSEYTRRE